MNEFKIKNGLLVSGSITGVTESGADNSAKMASTAWVRNYVTENSGAAIRSVQSFTATASQTTFTISGGYTVGLVDVYLNGAYINTASYTASDGTTVVLTDAAALDDILDVVIYKSFSGFVGLADYVTLNTNQTITGEKTFSGLSLQLAAAGSANATILRNTSGTTGSTTGFNTIGFNNVNNIYVSTQSRGGFIFSFNNSVSNRTYTLQDASGTLAFTSDIPSLSGYVQGSGTTNYLPKFTGSTTIGNSNIQDSGSQVTVGTGLYINAGTNTNVGNGIHAYYESNYAQIQLNGATGSLIDFSTSGTDFLGRIIYTNSTNVMDFHTSSAGTPRLSIGGNVIINTNLLVGTTTDNGARLQVSGASDNVFNLTRATVGTWSFNLPTSGNLFLTNRFGTNVFQIADLGAATFSSSVTARNYGISEASAFRGGMYTFNQVAGSGTDYSVGLFSEGEIYLASGGSASKKVVLTSSGNVGIGTSSPLSLLHINGSSSGAIQAYIHNTNGATNSSAELVFGVWSGAIPTGSGNPGPSAKIVALNTNVSNAATDLTFHTYSSLGTSAERLRITSGGNVLIGTTTDLGFRTDSRDSLIVSNSQPASSFQSTTGAFYIRGEIRYDMGPTINYYPSLWRQQLENIGAFSGTSDLVWAMSPNGGAYQNMMRFKGGSGNVLIGTSTDKGSTAGRLQVNGGIHSSTGYYSTGISVTISALNINYILTPTAYSGLIVLRDNLNGGSAVWLADPNYGYIQIANNMPGTWSISYVSSNTVIQKTSGNTGVVLGVAFYSNQHF